MRKETATRPRKPTPTDPNRREHEGPPQGESPLPTTDLVPVVGGNLKRLRTEQSLSLEKLAKLSGVSRAMLNQIELAQSAPTINVVWRIATALGVPFGALLASETTSDVQVLPASRAKMLTSYDGSFSSRALFPFDAPRRTEFYELRLRAKGIERAEPHPPGTLENLVVSQGSMTLEVRGERYTLSTGDAVMFAADVPHVYENTSDADTLAYLVMMYRLEVG